MSLKRTIQFTQEIEKSGTAEFLTHDGEKKIGTFFHPCIGSENLSNQPNYSLFKELSTNNPADSIKSLEKEVKKFYGL